nr:LysR substrate-binding domain-containing protein [Salipiger sp. CCB-MM3]
MPTSKQIAAFRAVMLTGGVNSAAQMLRLTQPAVSRQIRDLEDSTGLTLFLRKRGGTLRPTADAAKLFKEVERHYHGLDQIAQAVRNMSNRRGGRLRVASMPSLYLSILPDFIGAFTGARPETDVPLMATSSDAIIEWVERGQVDVGLVDWPFSHPNLKRVPLAGIDALAVLPEGHHLLQKDVLGAADFADEDFISLPRATQFRYEIDRFFQSAGVERRFGREAHLSMAACSMVGAGHGLSIVDPITAAIYWNEGIEFRLLRDVIRVEFSVVYLQKAEDNVLLKEFVSEFQNAFRSYTSELPSRMERRSWMLRSG